MKRASNLSRLSKALFFTFVIVSILGLVTFRVSISSAIIMGIMLIVGIVSGFALLLIFKIFTRDSRKPSKNLLWHLRKEKVSYYLWKMKKFFGNSSILIKFGILLCSLSILLPLATLAHQGILENPLVMTLSFYFTMLLLLGTFTIFFARKRTERPSPDIETLRLKLKVKKLFQKPRIHLKSIIAVLSFIIFSIISFILIFTFNLLIEGLVFYGIMFVFLCMFMPSSLKHPKSTLIRKRRLKGAFLTIALVIFATVLGWSYISLKQESCPVPSFALVSQDYRRNGIDHDLAELQYLESPEELDDITFNSLLVIKFTTSLSTNKKISFHVELIPDEIEIPENYNSDGSIQARVHEFNSKMYKGPFKERDIYFKVDLNDVTSPILPGNYTLMIYSTSQHALTLSKVSPSHTYQVEIEKDSLRFNPNYFDDPLRSDRRGSMYSIYNKEDLAWENFFNTRLENSLGEPVEGVVSLYMAQAEGRAMPYKKVTDFEVRNDGLIFYKTTSRVHYREYMRGKIVFDGSQSLLYKTIVHYEDMEVATNKFVHTSSYGDREEYTYNGTEIDEYNLNEFKKTTHLFYFHDFSPNELQWTESPNFDFGPNPPPTMIYLDISDDTNTYIQSPEIMYLGTRAEIATFTYKYELYNYGNPSDEIWIDLQSQVYRDGTLVHEQYDFQGYYNTQGENWQVVNIDLTDHFVEAGQKFRIRINADFTFEPGCDDEISIRYDYAKLEAFHDPVYYRGFDFTDGFNQFNSPTMGTNEPLYWDLDHPLSLGNEILSYAQYSGLVTNNYFDQDFRLDGSWDAFSGLFSEDISGNPIFNRDDEINLAPSWTQLNDNGMALFDLLGVNPPINVSDTFQSIIQDEFASVGDSDSSLQDIRQRFAVPKIVSNSKYVIIVFAGRYSSDNQWKIYVTNAVRPNGDFSTPVRVYDPGDDNIYQLAPSIALSETDLYVTWQQRNRISHSDGETEWTVMYARISLSDFSLKDVKNVTIHDSSNVNKTAFMAPDIALTPIINVYDANGDILIQDCIVHCSFENSTWTNLDPGGRDNEGPTDITKNIYYSQLNSSYFASSFSEAVKISDKVSEGGGGGGGVSNWHSEHDTEQTITSTSYVEKHTLDFNAPAQGDYLIIVSCEVAPAAIGSSVGVRAQLDDTTTFMEALYEGVNSNRNLEYKCESTMYLAEGLASGSHSVDIDALQESGTGYIRYARIIALRLDDWLTTTGMHKYAANEGVLDLTAGNNVYSDAVSITFTPDTAGDYLVLASMEMYSGNTGDSNCARIDYDSASEHLPVENDEETSGENYVTYVSKDNTDWHSFVWGGIVNIPASSKTIKVEACRTGGTTTTADVRRRRIIAIRLDAMSADSQFTEDASKTSTTTQWSDKSTLQFTPSSQQDYFIIGGMVIKPDSTSYPGHVELTHTAGTSTGTISLANIDSRDSGDPADCIPTIGIAIKELNAESQTFKTRYGYANTQGTTYGKGSFIVAVPLGGGGSSVINFNGNLESPQIRTQSYYNTTSFSEDSTEISMNFDQAIEKRIIGLSSLSITTPQDDVILLFSSESDFVKEFGTNSLLFDQDKILLPDDLRFHDIYDPRTYYFAGTVFLEGNSTYQLNSFFYDNVSFVKNVKDVLYSDYLLNIFQIEELGNRLGRNNYSIMGNYGSEDLNITFSTDLPAGTHFYVKYSMEDYVLPRNLTAEVNTIKNEVALIFESHEGNTERNIYLDVSNASFYFDEDILVSSGVNDETISRHADIIYDIHDLLNIIYSSQVNDSFSQLLFKHTVYNSSSGKFDREEIISDPINFSNYEFYKMLDPIVNLAFNNTLILGYETNYKKNGESQKWKIQYQYLDPVTNQTLGPFYIKSGESSQERNADAFWSNGQFWTFSANNSNNWGVEFTSCHRADLTSFSTLAADFMPTIYNSEMFSANLSIFFLLDLSNFNNDLLESEDRLRFVVSLEESGRQFVLLDTDWNSQSLDAWIENNLGTYYPKYLRYFHDLSLSSLTFSEINATDQRVQNDIYPFEVQLTCPVNFSEHFTLRFNLVKDDWSLNTTSDIDRYQMGIDQVDIAFEAFPKNYSANTFGVLTRSDSSSTYAKSEFLLCNEVNLDDIEFLSDSSLIQTSSNEIDLLFDFDAFSLLFDAILQLQFFPTSSLECEMMIMTEGSSNPTFVLSDEIIYDSWTGYHLGDLSLTSKWSKDFGTLYYSLNPLYLTVDIYNKENYFALSLEEKRELFSLFESLDQDFDEIYIVFKFAVKTFDLNEYDASNGINLMFNEITLPIKWQNSSGYYYQNLTFSTSENAFFEKLSKEARLNLLSEFGIEVDGRQDFISMSSFSSGFYPSGSEGNDRYYLPANHKDIEKMTASDCMNLLIRLSDCVGYYDSSSGLLIDGPSSESGEVGLIGPTLISNETCSYSIRAILDVYPFFNYQNGTDLSKSMDEFKSELLKIKLNVYNSYYSSLLSRYSNTLVKMQDFDINDFNFTTNSEGEKFYYMDGPLKIYIYGNDVVITSGTVFFELIAEFLDAFYITDQKVFRNQWGVIIDSFKLEFIQDKILPEFVNLEPFDLLHGETNVIVRALGDDYEWGSLWYNYKNQGENNGYDLIANMTEFNFEDNHAFFNFTWNTTSLVDDSIYKVMVILQNNKGLQGNASITNITIINNLPDITCNANVLTQQGWGPIHDLQEVSNYIKLSTINNDALPLITVKYYLHDESPTEQNRASWTRIAELSDIEQDFDYFVHPDNIPNGTWYLISEAQNGGPQDSFNVFENCTVINKFENSIQIGSIVSKQDSVSLSLSDTTESFVTFAKFWAQKQGTQDWTLINNATHAPFEGPLINLPWTGSTVFDILAELKLIYPLFGMDFVNLSIQGINLDLDGPTISLVQNPNDVLYQIQQAGGTWTATSSFEGFINGSITSMSEDFESYQLEYDYGKGWRYDSKTYGANETLNWNIRYMPDGDVSIKIIGYDQHDNPSNALEYSFINDQNYYDDLYIENYAFDAIYPAFESLYLKIVPIAQDIMSLSCVIGLTVYTFSRINPPAGGIYFEKYIEFDLDDFDFENQSIDTQIITIVASDESSQTIKLTIPITVSLALDTDVHINDLQIEKNFYHLDVIEETAWWKFDENGGIIIHDSSGSNDGTLIGTESWTNGKVGISALEFDTITYLASQPSNFSLYDGTSAWDGDLRYLDGDYTSFMANPSYYTHYPSQPSDFEVNYGSADWAGDLEWLDNDYTTFDSEYFSGTFIPSQPDNFTVNVGTAEWGGNLGEIDGSYTNFTSGESLGSPLTTDIRPDNDHTTVWDEGASTPHWNKIEEQTPDGVAIADTGSIYGYIDRHYYENPSIGNDVVITQVKLYVYAKKDSGATVGLGAKFETGSIWSSEKGLTTSSSYSWRSCTWSGLDLTKSEINLLTVALVAHNVPAQYRVPGKVYVDAAYVRLTYQNKVQDVDVVSQFQLNSSVLFAESPKFYYSHKTNISQQIDLQIWNHTSQSWNMMNSSTNSQGFYNNIFNLTSDHYNSSLDVKIRYFGSNSDSFKLHVEKLKIFFEFHILDFNSTITLDSEIKYSSSAKLHYSYLLNLSNIVEFKIWNSDNGNWSIFDMMNYGSFQEKSFTLTSSHYDASYVTKLDFLAISNEDPFYLKFDLLKVYFENHTLFLDCEFPVASTSNALDLLYSYAVNYSVPIEFSIYNHSSSSWELITNSIYSNFSEHYLIVDNTYLDPDFDILLRFYGTAEAEPFRLDLDLLKAVQYKHVQVPSVFSEDQDPFSLAGWVYVHELSEQSAIYGEFHDDGSARNYVSILDDGSLSFDQHSPIGGSAVSEPGLIVSGEWIHFAVVKDGDTVTFYKNGAQFGPVVNHTETYSGSAPTTAGLAARYYSARWHHDLFDGKIDDFRIFDEALPLGGVKLLYNNSLGTNQTLQYTNYDGMYHHDDKIFPISNLFLLNATSSYSNAHQIPFYNTRPQMKFVGQNYGNSYKYSFFPNIDLDNKNNLSSQVTRSISGHQVLKIEHIPDGFLEISKLFVDTNADGTYSKILDPIDLFYYYSIHPNSTTLFIQFNDEFIEHDIYDVKVEYIFSVGILNNFTFILPLDVSNLVSDIYDVEIICFDIHNSEFSKEYPGMNIDYDGPTIIPQFNNGVGVNHTSGEISFDISDPNDVDSAILEIYDSDWREFNGNVEVQDDIYTFKFSESELLDFHKIKLIANDSLGYTSILSGYKVFFDDTVLGFFPETLLNGYLFNGSNLIHIKNSTGGLFNKSVASLHVYTHSEYTDLGYYYDLPPDFNDLIIDSSRLPDGEHTIYFEFVDTSGNSITYSYPLIVDNTPPEIASITLFDTIFKDEIFFNDQVDLNIVLNDISDISSANIFVSKILGDPALYEMSGQDKVWSSVVMRRDNSDPGEQYYLNPDVLTYSFHDGWLNGQDFIYQNVLDWNDWSQEIPFIELSIYDIEMAETPTGVEIPFFFDSVKQEITFDERYRHYLTDDVILKGVKCDQGWSASFTANAQSWNLLDFDVTDFFDEGTDPEWYDNLFEFDNDDSMYNLHYDYPREFLRNRFEFYFIIEDVYGNTIRSRTYQGMFDDLEAEGSFGKILGDTTQGKSFWELGRRSDAGNVIFGTSNNEHRTLYFTPGYVYDSSSGSYYVKHEFLFLHNIESIKLYNASDHYIGDMKLDPTASPHPLYKFELNSKDFVEGLTYVKAEIYDQAFNKHTIIQDLYVLKEGPNDLRDALNFGDVIYYDRDVNYTENPMSFSGFLNNVPSHENKSSVKVEMSYYDYSEEIWVPMGTTTTSDGNFQVDWHVDNNTFNKLLPHQRGYIPINFTHDEQSNHFYGSYGTFDDSGVVHPFLIDLSGNIYVYSFNESNKQWFINYTIDLGFSLIGWEISNLDLNRDNMTDLVLFDRLSSSNNISLFIFNSAGSSFDFNQTILASDIDLPEPLGDPVFKESCFIVDGNEFLTMYACVSDSSNSVNYIARLDFDESLSMTQENDGTQLPALRVVSALHVVGDTIYIGAVNPIVNGMVNSSLFYIDKDLSSNSITFLENSTKGAIVDINSFDCSIGKVVVIGISMSLYNEDDRVLYYVFDTSAEIWYKTEFSSGEFESFSNETYDFRIRQIVKSKEQYAESVLISSSQGLWKTSIATDVIALSSTPVYYAVDSFRKWDLYTYEQDSDTSLIPFSHYPVMEIVVVHEYDRYLDSGSYIYDEIDAIDPSGYFIALDKRHLVCKKSYWNWRPKYQDDGDADIYYQVRYFYKATVAEASGLLSASYETTEHEHVGNVAARNSQTRTQNLGLQLQNLHDTNHWTFYYGTSSHGTKDWNYQSTEASTGIPFVLSQGVFESSGITSVADLSMLTEFNNVRMNYQDIHFKDDQVFMNSTLSQFETGQDFYHPENYQNLYENSYIDNVWVEDLSLSSSFDFRTDSLDDEYASLLETMGDDINGRLDLNSPGAINLDTKGTVLYKPDIFQVDIESDGVTYVGGSEAIPVLTERDGYLKAFRTGAGAANPITIDVSFTVDHNDDSESIKGILLSTAFAQRVESVYYLPPWSNITISLLTTGNPTYFLHTEPVDGSVNYFWNSLNKDDVVSITYNYGESINPWCDEPLEDPSFRHEYDEENGYYHAYYLPSNDVSGGESANWLYEGSDNNDIDNGLFRRVQDNMFIFTYPNEYHVYDFNYLRLDTRNIDNFIVDGEITFRISLNGYLPLILNSYGISLSELVLKQFQCLLFSDKDNLNNENWDVLYTANTREGAHGGFILDSGSVRLNTESRGYPQKGYIDSNDKRYRMVTRFYKDAQTANSITFKIGNSDEFTYDKVDFLQGVMVHSIEVTYDSSTWRFFVDGVENTFFSQSAFSSVTSLYPTITVSDGRQLEIIEIKNQIFEKITDPSDWPVNDEESVTIPAPPRYPLYGDQENDLTYSEASLKREIIYSFNKDLSNLNYVFDDLRLWADIDHYTEGPSGTKNFNPGYKLFNWTDPDPTNIEEYTGYFNDFANFDCNSLYYPPVSPDEIQAWNNGEQVYIPVDEYGNPIWDLYDDYIKSSDEKLNVVVSNDAIAYLNIWGGQQKLTWDSGGGLSSDDKPYITEIALLYDFDWHSNYVLQYPVVTANIHFIVGDADLTDLRMEFSFNEDEQNNQKTYPYSGSKYLLDNQEIYLSDGLSDPIVGYPETGWGPLSSAFSYTKLMEFTEIWIGLTETTTEIPMGGRVELGTNKLNLLLRMSDTPVAFRDYFYSDQCPDTEYDISYSQSNAFSILTKDNSKVTLNNDANYDATDASIKSLYKAHGGAPESQFSWNSLIFDTSFGPNTLSFEANSQSVYPNFAEYGGDILAHNSINDFRIVPDLNKKEGKGLTLTTYPYGHSWWHEQEFVSALPFDLSFSEIDEGCISEISDIVFKVQFNASVANFSSWSWRPNLKVYDYIHDEWLPYEGIIYPYHSEEALFVWNAQESGTKQHEYDTAQKLHEQDRYYSNSEDDKSDNCTVVFKLSKDKYDFGDLVRYDDLLGKSYITLLGLTYVIPGTYVDDPDSPLSGSWDIVYDDNFNSKGRMNVSSCLSFSHSYARAFRHTDVIKKNVKLSNESVNEFDAPSIDNPWIDLTGDALGSIDVRDIARIDNVFGITSNPKMVCVLMDPTPETPVGVDFWRFNRTEGRLYLPIDAILKYDKFNFTMELWVDFTQDLSDIYKFTPP